MADLTDFEFVAPIQSWSLLDALAPTTGEAVPILGFRVGGKSFGFAIPPEALSDITIELGQWLTAHVAAITDQHHQ